MFRIVTNWTIIIILFVFASCLLVCGGSPYSDEIPEVLQPAGDNRVELEKVLSHYASGDDSLKLNAALYLIANMEGHCYVTYSMVDTVGTTVAFDVLDYKDYESLTAAADSLESKYGMLDFERNEKINDLDSIKAEFLIKQIDYAFKAWREKPWAKSFSFENFCEYILPYRGSNEPLEEWRQTFWDKYIEIESGMTNSTDPVEAAAIINDDIKSWFGFDPRYYYHPTDQGLSEMVSNGLGRCEDMTNVTIYAMRANGLAVTSDYTPYWANTGNNHAWNAIVTPDGKAIPFMGAESNPGEYHLANKLGKAYRKTFGKQIDNLVFQEQKQEELPGWLAGKNYIDVTSHYTNVCDVEVKFEEEIDDSIDIAYLCVFNSGEWKPIHWGRIENGSAKFSDMGTNIAYLPALYVNKEILPYGAPFILGEDNNSRKLQPTNEKIETMKLISTTYRKLEKSTDGISQTFFTPGQKYELSYWSDGWQSLGLSVASDGPLVFEDVPEGYLYWLVAKDSDSEERIFTFESDSQIWY